MDVGNQQSVASNVGARSSPSHSSSDEPEHKLPESSTQVNDRGNCTVSSQDSNEKPQSNLGMSQSNASSTREATNEKLKEGVQSKDSTLDVKNIERAESVASNEEGEEGRSQGAEKKDQQTLRKGKWAVRKSTNSLGQRRLLHSHI